MAGNKRTQDDARRKELGAFLLARRQALQPEDIGLRRIGRRRVPGLRRSEIADAAAVSETWYTWLEQGREIRTTPDVIDALASALRLDEDGHRHLRRLAGIPMASSDFPIEAADRALSGVVNDLMPNPAHLMTRTTDLLAWNRSYSCLFADPAALLPEHRNGIWIQFMELRERMSNWDEENRMAVGRLRAEASKDPGDPEMARLVDELSASSESFRQLWASREVHSFSGHLEEYKYPGVGAIVTRAVQLRPLNHPHHILMIHYLEDDESRKRMLEVLSREPSEAGVN